MATEKYAGVTTDEKVVCFDLSSGQVLCSYDRDVTGDTVAYFKMIKRNGTPWLVSLNDGGDTVLLRNALKTEEETALDGEAASTVACSSDGRLVAIATEAGTFVVWDVDKGTDVGFGEGGHTGSIDCMLFSPDDQWLVTGGQDGRVVSWKVNERFGRAGTQTFPSPITSMSYMAAADVVVCGLRSGQVAHLHLKAAKVSAADWGTAGDYEGLPGLVLADVQAPAKTGDKKPGKPAASKPAASKPAASKPAAAVPTATTAPSQAAAPKASGGPSEVQVAGDEVAANKDGGCCVIA